jgi:hypothetical protein
VAGAKVLARTGVDNGRDEERQGCHLSSRYHCHGSYPDRIVTGGFGLLDSDEEREPAPPLIIASVVSSSKVGTFNVRCPFAVQFIGKIDVASGMGTITYRWLRQDGGPGSPTVVGDRQTVTAGGPGTIEVRDEWTANVPVGEVGRSETLEVLTPNNLRSNTVSVSGRCDYRLPAGPPNMPPDVPGGPPGG